MNSFYCQKSCGEVGFYIKEWNKNYKEINAMDISEEEKRKLIHPDPCKEQCFNCMAIVGERRLKTQTLINNKK